MVVVELRGEDKQVREPWYPRPVRKNLAELRLPTGIPIPAAPLGKLRHRETDSPKPA